MDIAESEIVKFELLMSFAGIIPQDERIIRGILNYEAGCRKGKEPTTKAQEVAIAQNDIKRAIDSMMKKNISDLARVRLSAIKQDIWRHNSGESLIAVINSVLDCFSGR